MRKNYIKNLKILEICVIILKREYPKFEQKEKFVGVDRKTKLMQILYYMIAILVVIIIVCFITKPDLSIFDVPSSVFKIVQRNRIPTEEDMKELESSYQEVYSYLAEKNTLKEEITEYYNQNQTYISCSRVNAAYNSLDEKKKEYDAYITEMERKISVFEAKYNEYEELLDNIPKFAVSLRRELNEAFRERLDTMKASMLEVKAIYQEDKEEIERMHAEALERADYFYNRDYEPMCRLVNAEGGNTPDMEMCYIARVAENREEHPAFKYYTLHDVMYAPGQYSTVPNGIKATPNARVKRVMAEYLRGRIEVDMPDDVVYQARFPQGSRKDEPWKIMESGHYFCYY